MLSGSERSIIPQDTPYVKRFFYNAATTARMDRTSRPNRGPSGLLPRQIHVSIQPPTVAPPAVAAELVPYRHIVKRTRRGRRRGHKI